eukprot:COSAG06_NODE_7957_length_2323_cov_2.992356_2_plen_237_part_00
MRPNRLRVLVPVAACAAYFSTMAQSVETARKTPVAPPRATLSREILPSTTAAWKSNTISPPPAGARISWARLLSIISLEAARAASQATEPLAMAPTEQATTVHVGTSAAAPPTIITPKSIVKSSSTGRSRQYHGTSGPESAEKRACLIIVAATLLSPLCLCSGGGCKMLAVRARLSLPAAALLRLARHGSRAARRQPARLPAHHGRSHARSSSCLAGGAIVPSFGLHLPLADLAHL